ncbi:hypothetical protein KL928_003834 [Ogataea angusta]|uniref:Uncharacterized protein n=1 Tax=Pichia angusta TaxID=870730 RepID=A0AAN6DEZ0_PICAN|nr:uncharacterized protein KL928_003834 [Ogataea angusta]KAG7817935.1 hypothetical protein KL928_003834 [Ogataea angusta]
MWRQKSYTDDTAPGGRRSLHRDYNPGAPFDIDLQITYAIGVGFGRQYLILDDYKAPFLAIVLRHKREAKKLYADAQCKLGDRMYSKRYDLIVLGFVYARRAS